MAEPLSTPDLSNRLSNLKNHARALEMAINGAEFVEPYEHEPLSFLTETLIDKIRELITEVDAQLEAERGEK
ncbi:hypothetical protein [Methylocystis echinoides]|uniref:Uncharacterized protein n=1 Tax=Methylocystis echinoides TaxID=29468 RepID=A0A9W6LTV9_9HYPH|nr:hypothetical protein [Methylocystis echinoides]GLI95033.1 hypothetical protein LMG27198_40250 [Methylocystis echinoides]